MRFVIVLILYFISAVSTGYAQTTKPIKWAFSISKTELKQGDVVEITMKAELKPDWYIYSSDFDPNLGPTVTSILFDIDDSYRLVNQLKPIGAKEKYDALWEGYVRYFTESAEFRQELKILRKDPVIKARIYYQVCNDKVGKCIPYEETIYFDHFRVEANEVAPKDSVKTEEVKPDNPNVTAQKKTNPTNATVKKATPPPTLEELEAAKEKLISKGKDGKDLSVKQLSEFVQKYGGGK